MKVLVAVKRVIDYQVKIRVQADGSGVETQHVKMSMNPFDEIAVEEALRWKEQGIINEVIVASIGQAAIQETLRQALAMGADRAILIDCAARLEPIHVACLLQALVKQENPQLVILGKQAIDDDCNQTGQMLAGLLDWPQATFASRIAFENNAVIVTREVDGGLETLRLTLPALITTDLRLNTPRIPSLPNIMKARTKPMQTYSPEDLEVEIKPHSELLHVELPVSREPGIKINSIKELFDLLKNKHGVL